MNQEIISINDQLNLKKQATLTFNFGNDCQLDDFSDYQTKNIQFEDLNFKLIETSEQDSPILLDKKKNNMDYVFSLS